MTSHMNQNPDYYEYYENIDELKQYESDLYNKAYKHMKIEELACFYVYETPKDYAEYNIKEGYYALDFSTSPIDLSQFIDYDKLIDYLLKTSDKDILYHDEVSNKLLEVLN